MTFRILTDDRKEVVRKLEEMTGNKAVYTRVPRCAYILNGIAVENDKTITTDENADMSLLLQLIREGMVEGEIPEEALETEQNEQRITEEPGQEEPSGAESIHVEKYQGEDATAEEADTHGSDTVKPEISFPLSRHRPESVCNLVYTIFSKGKLLSKSTGGDFSASERLVNTLRNFGMFTRIEQVLEVVRQAGVNELHGIDFTEDRIIFDGFPETSDPLVIRAWMKLSEAINRQAINQLCVRAKETQETNEKFAFRTWLIRLGLNGPELKQERNILYKNLSGHTAFRTPADEEKWKARQAVKRAELKDRKDGAE